MTNKLRFNLNCDKRPEWLDSDNKKSIGDIDMTMSYGEPFIPINPETGKPYFSFNDNGFDGVWTAQKVTPIPSSEFGGDNE